MREKNPHPLCFEMLSYIVVIFRKEFGVMPSYWVVDAPWFYVHLVLNGYALWLNGIQACILVHLVMLRSHPDTIFDKIWHFVISTIVVINKNLEFSLHPVDGCMRGNGMPRNARYSQKWEQILSPKMIIPWKKSSLMEGERGKWRFACWRFEE